MAQRPGQVVLLNGVGSVGKSAIAKAMQAVTTDPYLHVPMDSFLDMLPAESFGRPEGLTFEESLVDDSPVIHIRTGTFAELTFHGMRQAVAAMSSVGLNLIVDDVVIAREVAEYRALIDRLHVVKVTAPLAVLEQRERLRGDRIVGLARGQHPVLHADIVYDLTVRTESASPEECAHLIAATFGL
ncbi:MAG: chloramphenicol phosphotransferase [Actinomycetes bacterium]